MAILPAASLGLMLAGPALAAAPDAQALFAQAVAADLGHPGHPDPARAFSLYARAAEAGLAPAQLNAAVMLDSGRGTPHDAARAATYYAMAASQGMARAAYDLGQLYADGEGVPANKALARAWLRVAAAKGLSAASQLLARLVGSADGSMGPAAPTPMRPQAGSVLATDGGFVFVWTAPAQQAATSYYVEVARLDGAASADVFTTQVDVSAVTAPGRAAPGRYAWRVFSVCPSLGRYVPSAWVAFSID